MVEIVANILSLRALGILLAAVIAVLALGKWGVIGDLQVSSYIEALLLGFGTLILIIETFRESRFRLDLAGVLALITIFSTTLLTVERLFGLGLGQYLGSVEAPIFTGLTVFIIYELFFEGGG